MIFLGKYGKNGDFTPWRNVPNLYFFSPELIDQLINEAKKLNQVELSDFAPCNSTPSNKSHSTPKDLILLQPDHNPQLGLKTFRSAGLKARVFVVVIRQNPISAEFLNSFD